jgi:hypothetical protein
MFFKFCLSIYMQFRSSLDVYYLLLDCAFGSAFPKLSGNNFNWKSDSQFESSIKRERCRKLAPAATLLNNNH